MSDMPTIATDGGEQDCFRPEIVRQYVVEKALPKVNIVMIGVMLERLDVSCMKDEDKRPKHDEREKTWKTKE